MAPTTSQFTWVNPSNSMNTQTMTTTDTYDGNGNLIKTVSPDGTTSSTYNPNGDVTKSVDALGGVTTILYNADGKAIQTTTPTGMVTDTVYNSQNLVTYTDDPHLPGEPCDGTHTTYDQAGDVIGTERLANVVITVSTANGISSSVLTSVGQVLSISTTTYNAAGQVVQTVDPSGMITNNFYDNAGDLIETQEIVNGVTRTSTSTYNADGETTSTTDPLETRPSTSTMATATSRRPSTPTAVRSSTSTISRARRSPRSMKMATRRNTNIIKTET